MRLQISITTLTLLVWFGISPLMGQNNLPSGANHRSSYYSKVQNKQENFTEFSGFLYLFRKKASIPKDLVRQYAPLSSLKGNFQAKGFHKLPNGMLVLILEQRSSMCVRQHLLTTNGEKIINQRLVSERCTPAPGAHSNEFSALEYKEGEGFYQVIYKDVFLPEKDRLVIDKRRLKINSNGAIVPVQL
ncbi:MAG: hypothetical protein MRZ79_15900 [Bacteroidia bacterium]|nr:hypothetical protein [Bacteroidia bacterium]